MLKRATSFLAAIAFASAASAGATYGFTNITNNKAGDAAIGEAQFTVDITEESAGFVRFKFSNSGPEASSMVQLYWEDTTNLLSSIASWSTTTPSEVDFSGGSANPAHLPGSSPKIDDFSIQAKSQGGKSQNGVGVGEDVLVRFNSDVENYYAEVIQAVEKGELIIGVHAQAFASGGSESFVTGNPPNPPSGVPSPTAAIAGLGLLGMLAARRRRRD